MGNLKYAILGLLKQKEMTGYDLMKQFESTLCEFWSAKHSQIYPELKKLTDEGNIAYKIEPSENGSEKNSIILQKLEERILWTSSLLRQSPSPHRKISPA